MFDDFEFNPTVEIDAIEFTFDNLDPALAMDVAEVLARSVHYSGLRYARWVFVNNDGQHSLRAEHVDNPITVDWDSLGDQLEAIRAETEQLFQTYNSVLGSDVEFEGVGFRFVEPDFPAFDD